MRTLCLVLATGLASGLAQYPGSTAVPFDWKQGFDSINSADASAMVHILAGPDFNGRSPREPGYKAAAEWVADRLRQYGIAPAGENGTYFQHFTLQQVRMEPQGSELKVEGTDVSLVMLEDYAWQSLRDFDVNLPIVFVSGGGGAGIQGLDKSRMRGAIVIVSPDSLASDPSATESLLRSASDIGAVAIVVPVADEGRLFVPFRTAIKELPPEQGQPFQSFVIRLSAARRLAEAVGATSYLAASASETTMERPAAKLICRGKPSRVDQFQTMNVLGKIDGTDPVLRKETVAIGSHLDHIGTTPNGIGWGADDNASGCVANLLIARAISQNRVKPKRTILFGFWSCEELGLWGSNYYVNRPTMPIADTISYLNMDMVGRDAEFPRWNDKSEDNDTSAYISAVKFNSRPLYELLQSTNRHVNLLLRDDKEDRAMRSDSGSFIRKGVPTLKAFTGEHPDYHKVTDTPDKINSTKLANVAKWLYLSAQVLASGVARPAFEVGGRYLTGRVTYSARVTLTTDAVVEISLVDVTNVSSHKELDRVVVRRPGQVPVHFALRHDQSQILPEGKYVIKAKITDRGEVVFTNGEGFGVLTQGGASSGVEVIVSPKN